MNKTAIVTGGSSGIGSEIARTLYAKGCKVYEFSRRDSHTAFAKHMKVDVSDEKAVEEAVAEVVKAEGKIDILVCNAGFGISGAIEFTDNADAKKLLDVNLFGTVNTSKAVIKYMRKAGDGRIVCTSSVAGSAPIPFQCWYSISKASVNAFVCALANEVKPFNISVCAVMPGDIKTGFTAAREKNINGDEIYNRRISSSVQRMEKDETNGMEPIRAGKYIAHIALKKRVKPLYAIGFVYKLVCVLLVILPVRLRNYIIGKMYAD